MTQDGDLVTTRPFLLPSQMILHHHLCDCRELPVGDGCTCSSLKSKPCFSSAVDTLGKLWAQAPLCSFPCCPWKTRLYSDHLIFLVNEVKASPPAGNAHKQPAFYGHTMWAPRLHLP